MHAYKYIYFQVLPPSVARKPSILHVSGPKTKYLKVKEKQAVVDPMQDTRRFATAKFSRMKLRWDRSFLYWAVHAIVSTLMAVPTTDMTNIKTAIE